MRDLLCGICRENLSGEHYSLPLFYLQIGYFSNLLEHYSLYQIPLGLLVETQGLFHPSYLASHNLPK